MVRRVECYFKNPDTKESGWDIQFVTMEGKSKRDIAEKIKQLHDFDCFIEFDFDEFN